MIDKTLLELDYKTSRADMYVWMNTDTNQQAGKEYYSFALIYVDYLIHIHHDPEISTKELKCVYSLKYGSL